MTIPLGYLNVRIHRFFRHLGFDASYPVAVHWAMSSPITNP